MTQDEINEQLLTYYDHHIKQARSIFADRQRKYTHLNIAMSGESAILARWKDKLSRIEAGGSDDTPDETVVDSHLDAVNYAIIHLMWVNDEWPRVSTDDDIRMTEARIKGLQDYLEQLKQEKNEVH